MFVLLFLCIRLSYQWTLLRNRQFLQPQRHILKMSGTDSNSEPARNKKKLRTSEWAAERGMEPGYGGIWPGNPTAPTHKVTVRSKFNNTEVAMQVPNDRYIYFAFEEEGIDLPVINQPRMCRQGCCTICTAKLIEGEVTMDNPLGLLKEMRKEGYFLTCCSYPKSDIVCELQNEDEMYIRQWSEGFEGGGVEWGGFLPEDD